MATNTQSFRRPVSMQSSWQHWIAFMLLLAMVFPFAQPTTAAGTTYYVDADAAGNGSGTSWANAFVNVQDALTMATSGDAIWLAEGVYYPDTGGEQTDNDRNARFNIPSGVKLYGGFEPSSGVVQFAARNWKLYHSVLSGDIDGNDTKDAHGVVTNTSGISGTNSLHVVYLDGGTVAVTSDTVIDGVVITAGAATNFSTDNAGGGLYCDTGVISSAVCSPTLTNMIFSGNKASQTGGAMSNDAALGGTSSPTLTNVTFSGNSAGVGGGALDNNAANGGTSSPILTNITFSGNSAGASGGAMVNRGYGGTSRPTLTNVTFNGNSAGGGGGALYSEARSNGTSSPTLTNVTFSGNKAYYAGAMLSDGNGGMSSPMLTNATFSGNVSGSNGGALYNAGRDGGTSNSTLTNIILWNNTASMAGASIYNANARVVIRSSIVQNGQASISNDSSGSATYDASNTTSDPRFDLPADPATAPTTVGILRLQVNSPAIDAGDTSAVPSSVTTDRDGKTRIINGKVDIGAYEFGVVRPAPTYYVNAAATGNGSGTSWANAFVNLQDALVKATSGNTIWLAKGVYYPDVGSGKTDNDQNARFVVPSGVKLYGGFDPALGIDQFTVRDGTLYPSVLSGDIDGNDTKDTRGVVTNASGITGANSTHVVYLDGQTVPVTSTTVLDGIMITAGAATAAGPNDSGGGLYCAGQTSSKACSPTLTNVTFSGNKASGNGGAMFNYGGSQGVSSPTLTSVTFSGNSAAYGGALYNYGDSQGMSSPTLTNVTFSGNLANNNGGAIYNLGLGGTSSPTLINVIFSGNKAAGNGGAIDNDGRSSGTSSPALTNVTFSGNSAGFGGAIYNFGNGGTSSPILVNTIVWNNTAGQGASVYNSNASVAIRSSIVQNGQASIAGGGITYDTTNKESDPTFVQPIDTATAPITSGDLHLKSGSPAIDAGDTSVALSGTTTDRDGKTRIIDGIIDMGAYEFGVGVVADIGFRPNPDGYSFSNDGENTKADYTIDDMRSFFGDTAVCDPKVNNSCVAFPAAEEWNTWANKTMNGGHCYGMSVTSLRFFKGLDSPGNFQNASATTYDLQHEAARRNITYYAIRQHIDPASSNKGTWLQKTPIEVLAGLRATMSAGAPDPSVLSVRQAGQGGHAIIPYTIEDRGNAIFWIKVYDNNHPNDDTLHVEVNTAMNTWKYDDLNWSGDANTHSLGLHQISYDDITSVCPWCKQSAAQLTANTQATASSQIFSLGQDQLVVVDEQGRRVGNSGAQTVNEIPGASINPLDGGLGIAQSIYNMPLDGTHTLLLDGQTLTRTVISGVAQFGPGYAVTADGIAFKPAIQHKLIITSDGNEATYQASDATSVNLTLAHDALGSTGDGYTFKLNGVDVGSNQSVKATVDTQRGAVVFSNAQAGGGSYNLQIERVTSAGKQAFAYPNITVSAGDTHYINYASWDGSGALTLQIDRGSDGSIDETIALINQLSASNSVYLPVVLK